MSSGTSTYYVFGGFNGIEIFRKGGQGVCVEFWPWSFLPRTDIVNGNKPLPVILST